MYIKRNSKKNGTISLASNPCASLTNTTGMAKACRETVIDGYNLIHKLWQPQKGNAMAPLRERLETLLSAYRKTTRRHVTVVYDGGAGPGGHSSSHAVDVLFSGTKMNADSRIVEFVRSLGNRAGLVTVVSSDLEIRQHVIAWGAAWTSSESFASELARLGLLTTPGRPPAGKPTGAAGKKEGHLPLGDKEVAQWMKLFGGEG